MIRHQRTGSERAMERRGRLRRFPAGRMTAAAFALIASASAAFGQDMFGVTQLALADGEAARIRTRLVEIMDATHFIAIAIDPTGVFAVVVVDNDQVEVAVVVQIDKVATRVRGPSRRRRLCA